MYACETPSAEVDGAAEFVQLSAAAFKAEVNARMQHDNRILPFWDHPEVSSVKSSSLDTDCLL